MRGAKGLLLPTLESKHCAYVEYTGYPKNLEVKTGVSY